MVAFHMIYGILLLILAIVVTIIEIARANGAPRALRGATIGLLDLQLIIGIITWIVEKPRALFVLHPIFMVVAILIAHIFTTPRKARRTRILGWVIADILFILGASLFQHFS
jgi:heme A synthase